MADITAVNPWTWQDAFGFYQAVDVAGEKRLLETVLAQAGLG